MPSAAGIPASTSNKWSRRCTSSWTKRGSLAPGSGWLSDIRFCAAVFAGKGSAQPVQDVVDRVQIPVERFDWRALAEAERHRRLQALLDNDRGRGFDLNQAPLMRLALMRATERDHWVLWTFHHALLDGRSFPLVLREVFAFHEDWRHRPPASSSVSRPHRVASQAGSRVRQTLLARRSCGFSGTHPVGGGARS